MFVQCLPNNARMNRRADLNLDEVVCQSSFISQLLEFIFSERIRFLFLKVRHCKIAILRVTSLGMFTITMIIVVAASEHTKLLLIKSRALANTRVRSMQKKTPDYVLLRVLCHVTQFDH